MTTNGAVNKTVLATFHLFVFATLKCISVYQMKDIDSYSDDALSQLQSVKHTQSGNQLMFIFLFTRRQTYSVSDDTLSHLPGVKQTQSVNQLMFIFLFTRRQTEIALAMTRYLTCQVLNRRNQGINYKMPNLKAFMRPRGIEQESEKGKPLMPNLKAFMRPRGIEQEPEKGKPLMSYLKAFMRPRSNEQELEKGMERKTKLNSNSLLHFSVFWMENN